MDRQIQVVNDTLSWRQEALKLQESRFKGGLVNEMDVSRARTELELARNDPPHSNVSVATQKRAAVTPPGQLPSTFRVASNARLPSPPRVPGGLPSTLLQRLLDIGAAEQKMREANAKIGVAKACSAFSIGGSGGLESIGAAHFYDARSRVLTIGPSMTLPIFQGGKLRSNLAASKATYEETLANYRQSILIALKEVEDSMLEDVPTPSRSPRSMPPSLRRRKRSVLRSCAIKRAWRVILRSWTRTAPCRTPSSSPRRSKASASSPPSPCSKPSAAAGSEFGVLELELDLSNREICCETRFSA